MATVFKAYQPVLDRHVAVKILLDYHARDPVFRERFRREARSVAKLDHPNIVQIYLFGEDEDKAYIVMQYVDGGTLKDRLKATGGPLSGTEALKFIIQAAEGLGAAHQQGIVHRDVKPANMLLRKDGHLLLSDFGIVKILEGNTNLTRVGTGLGTPQYMSPEQGTGQAINITSDIYSLGIVLFHCLCGRVPYQADHPLTVAAKHVNEPLPIAILRHAGVPPQLEAVIVKMTAKNQAERYQTTAEVIAELVRAATAARIPLPFPYSSVPINDEAPSIEYQPQPRIVSPPVPVQPQGQLICFRCQATNTSDRLYCTTCGYDLTDRSADQDKMMGPNGRPILAKFTLQNGQMAGRVYRFHQGVTTIGRTNGNDLIISGRTVSRRHARLWFAGGRWYIADMRSQNGTFVNTVRVQPDQAVTLNDGDYLNFGDELIQFHILY
jgi:serine/threonine protein kinase